MATIGIDVTALATLASGGIGTSQYRTMQALAALETPHRFILYAARPPVVPFSGRPLDLPWPVRLGTGHLTESNIVWMQTGVNRLLRQDQVDVFWGPRHLLPFLAPHLTKVATVHDFWDRYFPAQQPRLNQCANRLLISQVVARADVVVTPSRATARDVVRFCGLSRDRLQVVPWGVDDQVFKPAEERTAEAIAAHGLRRPYLLSLDVFNPRKNFAAVLEGAARLPLHLRQGLTIVGIGRPRGTALNVDVRQRAAQLGLLDQLLLRDDLPAEDLAALYSGALALVYPSLYEGFGMPILEAMACGCAVITSNRSSLPEVAGGAALLVDPCDGQDMAAALALLRTDAATRERLVAAGRGHAASFTWRRSAEGMIAAFERALMARGCRRR